MNLDIPRNTSQTYSKTFMSYLRSAHRSADAMRPAKPAADFFCPFPTAFNKVSANWEVIKS